MIHCAKSIATALAGLVLLAGTAAAQAPAASGSESWPEIEAAARGQTVYFHAWGGDTKINDFIAWAGARLHERHGVTLEHVKVSDIGETVTLVLAETSAGRTEGGRADLLWINGENFAAMKRNGLLHGPWVERLPSFAFVDTKRKPTTLVDFTVPTDGLEAPWGMAQLTFYYDGAVIDDPPRTIHDIGAWAAAHPGRFAYPAPPDFTGTTFLKQALVEMAPDPAMLADPVPDESGFEAATGPLWRFLDALHPHLWRGGATFPANYAALRQLVDDGETAIAFAFNPAEASSAISRGLLPDTVRSFVLDGGTIGNTHFLAIPFNAGAKAGAMVAAEFLLSPEAQARKADPEVWGDPTVLDPSALPPGQRHWFEAVAEGPALLTPDQLGRVLPEPHPSWTTRIEAAWLSRYSR